MLNSELLSAAVASHLPTYYETLLLSFRNGPIETRGDYAVIGDDHGTDLCANLATGEIMSIDDNGQLATRFVNSSIPQLARSILAHKEYVNRASKSQTESEQLTIVHEFRSQVAAIDQKALGDAENWWSVIIEQAFDGNL